jgi:DNA-binding response OmpR family regulator
MVIIDDEEWLLEMMELTIRNKYKNIDLRTFQDSKKAWQELAQRDPDLLITGANNGELSGEEIVRRLIEQKVAYPILVMSGWSPAEKWVKSFANKKPNISFLPKPFTTEQLHAEISKLLGRDDKDSQRKKSDHSECKPLLDAATKDLFRKNAFRITGLSVDATVRRISKHERDVMVFVDVGQDPHTERAAFPMKPPPNQQDFRDAFQKLKDPEKRLIDEFFWFWPEEFGNSESDLAIQALAKGDTKTAMEIWAASENDEASGITAKHNLALVYHVSALDWENYSVKNEIAEERRQKITEYWKGAFNRWERLAIDDRFWDKVTALIRQLNEPDRLPTGFARRMRATLPEALDKINAELAVAFAESGKIELARLHIRFMRETNQGLDNVEKTAELVLTPASNRLKEQIKSARDRGEKKPPEAAKVALELFGQAGQTLNLFDLFFAKDNELRNDLFDEVASVCNRLQIVYYKETGDDKTCLEILKAILPFATSTDLRQLIEKDISETCTRLESKKLEPVYTLLKSIQDSTDHPRSRLAKYNAEVANALISAIAGLTRGSDPYNQLWDSAAIVLRGISLDAWNKHEDMQTAVTANELAVKHAVSPELKQRLAEDKTTLQQMGAQMAAEKAAKRQSSKQTGVGCLVVVAIFIVLGIIGSCNSTNPSSSNSSYTPSPTPSTPAYTPPPVSAGGNSGGTVYSVPSTVSSTLDTEKAEIESERTTIQTLDAQVEKLGRDIENDRLYLDKTSQYAVDTFNAKVDRYNTLAQQDKAATAAFNTKVDNYNAKLRQYGR